jgi:hypothetical protein
LPALVRALVRRAAWRLNRRIGLITFAAAAKLMLRDLEEIGRRPTTLANYHQILGFRLLPRFGDIPVDRVTRSKVEALATQMLREGKAAQTRANTLKLLSQVFNYARPPALVPGEPALGREAPSDSPECGHPLPHQG